MDTQQQRLVAGRYRLLSPLGEGGMGTVWRARDELLDREVAVKEVSFPRGLSDEDRRVLHERTRREARAAAALSHPSAVTVYDVVEEDGAPYLVMELVEARTLSQVVREDGPLSPQRTAEVGLELLGALETAHRQGVLHRDVKPSNVMVRDDGRVVLTDFGIATTTGDASITHTGLLLGSPAYIAPERARGQAPGPPSDLWSLGATLFTAVEGRPPYGGDEPLLVVSAVVNGEHTPFVTAGPLAGVLDGLLDKDPGRRLDAPRARALLQEVADSGEARRTRALAAPVVDPDSSRTSVLDVGVVRSEVADPRPARVTPIARPPRRSEPARRRPGWLVPAAVVAALLALGGTGYALSADDDPDRPLAGPSPRAEPSAPAASAPAPSPAAPSPAAPSPAAPSPTAPSPAASPDAGAPGVPAGWTTDRGGAGWTVALPPGYRPTGAGEYRDAQTGRTLRIETGEGRPDAVADRERAASSFAERHPSYDELRIEAVDYRGYEAADWEFTYEGLHVLNRVFVVDGTGHSLYFQTRAGDFADARADFDGIAAAFRPVGG